MISRDTAGITKQEQCCLRRAPVTTLLVLAAEQPSRAGAERDPRDRSRQEAATHDQSSRTGAKPLLRPPDTRRRDGWSPPRAATRSFRRDRFPRRGRSGPACATPRDRAPGATRTGRMLAPRRASQARRRRTIAPSRIRSSRHPGGLDRFRRPALVRRRRSARSLCHELDRQHSSRARDAYGDVLPSSAFGC
jgi:hypothetical protein